MNKKSNLIIFLLFLLSITSFTISKKLNNPVNNQIKSETIAISLDSYEDKTETIKLLASDSKYVADNFCGDIQPTLKIVYYVLTILKIIVPLGIIIMATFDFYKAITGGSAEAIKKEAIILGKRCIIGLIIFFAPTIINTLINFADSDSAADYKQCTNCVFDGKCSNSKFSTDMEVSEKEN